MQTANLGQLEKQVMDIIWEQSPCSARDVLTKLRTEKQLAYTTVATILQRLYDKKLLNRKEDKAGYIYSPKLSKEQYSKKIAKSFLNKFIDSFGDTAIVSFAETVDTLPEKRKKYFLDLLETYDKNK